MLSLAISADLDGLAGHLLTRRPSSDVLAAGARYCFILHAQIIEQTPKQRRPNPPKTPSRTPQNRKEHAHPHQTVNHAKPTAHTPEPKQQRRTNPPSTADHAPPHRKQATQGQGLNANHTTPLPTPTSPAYHPRQHTRPKPPHKRHPTCNPSPSAPWAAGDGAKRADERLSATKKRPQKTPRTQPLAYGTAGASVSGNADNC